MKKNEVKYLQMNKSIYKLTKGEVISSYYRNILILEQIKIKVNDRGRQYNRKSYLCKCLECNNIYEIREDNLINNKHGCKKCSKGVSYGEKVMMKILDTLNISYIYDKTTEWSNNKRYDFYIPEYSLIIEIHGLQHYKEITGLKYRTLQEEKENDRIKKELAKNNNITHYVEIDYRKHKNKKFLLHNIYDSELKEILNLLDNLKIA